MKVCFLLNDLSLSGGVGVVLEHAHHLAKDHDFEVTLSLKDGPEASWPYRRRQGLAIKPLSEAIDEQFDVAVATWWRTAYDLFKFKADRHAYFVQSMEDRFYPDEVDRLQAATTHDLPVSFITEARWIADTLKELHPDAPCFYVRNGVAKDVFRPVSQVQPHTHGPLRVLIEGHRNVWFKAVEDAVTATTHMSRPRIVTYVTPQRDDASELPVDRVVGPLHAEEMAALYAETDVVLKLSRVEGMFGPPLEGFHMGATCVVAPVTGHEEYVVHGWNGVVAGWDDLRGTSRWLDLLAQDRRLLHYLRTNALSTAQAWPSWHQSSTFMAAALRAIRREPRAHGGAGHSLDDVKASTEAMRNERLLLEELIHMRDAELQAMVRKYEEVISTRAYRVGVAARERIWKHPLIRAIALPLRLARRLTRRGR